MTRKLETGEFVIEKVIVFDSVIKKTKKAVAIWLNLQIDQHSQKTINIIILDDKFDAIVINRSNENDLKRINASIQHLLLPYKDFFSTCGKEQEDRIFSVNIPPETIITLARLL